MGNNATTNLHPRKARSERDFRERERKIRGSGGFLDFASANASGARTNRFRVAAGSGAYPLQIGIPTPAPGIVGVAHHVAILGTFAAEITLHCHKLFLYCKNRVYRSSLL
jgi:hypothetical protein